MKPPPREQTPRQQLRGLLISVRAKIRHAERELKGYRAMERALRKLKR